MKISVDVKLLDKQRQLVDAIMDLPPIEIHDLITNHIDELEGLANLLSNLVSELEKVDYEEDISVLRGKEE